MIRFGPAGWDYPDWKGTVYPKPAPKGFDPLAYLACWFNTVEINTSFYGPPKPEVARAWLERLGDRPDFRFTAKLWKRLTHEREAYGREEVEKVRAAFDVLADADKLGAVLLQFPWSFKRDAGALEWLHDLFDALEGFPLVLEVRHETWNVPETYGELAEAGVGFVNLDQPLFKKSIRPSAVATASTGYVRIHGRNFRDWFRRKAARDERYDYLYTAEELEPWATRTQEIADLPEVEDIYVVTNNHFRGQAPANALMLESQVKGRRVKAPPELVETYKEALAPFVT